MITSFLKIDVDEFIEICIDTLTMVPIHKTAARLNRSIKCVFQNRHKFLSMLEKYFCYSHSCYDYLPCAMSSFTYSGATISLT